LKISIHQPQYYPWFPYLSKIIASDVFIILDSVDFQKNGLQNRNKIKTVQGASWLTIPIKHHQGQKILNVEIDNTQNWKHKHWTTIQQNYKKAAAFHKYAEELESLYQEDWTRLAELNITYLRLLLRWFNVKAPLMRSSQMKSTGKSSELLLNLCRETEATIYISGIGAKDYLDEKAFFDAGIQVEYRPPVLPRNYPQQFEKAGFINDLSSLDFILNCGDDWIKYVF